MQMEVTLHVAYSNVQREVIIQVIILVEGSDYIWKSDHTERGNHTVVIILGKLVTLV